MEYFLLSLIFLFINGAYSDDNKSVDQLKLTREFPPGYGRSWVFFPDGDGIPRYVNLTLQSSSTSARRQLLEDIEYRLYTRENMDVYEVLYELGEFNVESNINKRLFNSSVKVITHGWMSSADKSAVTNIKNAYLEMLPVNVIAVDWSKIANSFNYPDVTTKIEKVGMHVAKFLNALTNQFSIPGEKIHLIGHSLGAHIMGIAGSIANISVGRITGLDPARPLFEFPSRPLSKKLDASDAQFVDVIHSCSGLLGVEGTIADADFYPNNGLSPQPGCKNFFAVAEACSHGMSHHYFSESILKPAAYLSKRCKNWNEFLLGQCDETITFMGEYVNHTDNGKFYLRTVSDN